MNTVFFRVTDSVDKAHAILSLIDEPSSNSAARFDIEPSLFRVIPKSPFAYWMGSVGVRIFRDFESLANDERAACDTNPVGNDTRFMRAWWEVPPSSGDLLQWVPLCKGGKYSLVYQDVHMVMAWSPRRRTYLGFTGTSHRPIERPANLDYFFRPGLTWSRRSQSGLSMRVMPRGGVFAQKGPAVFVEGDDPIDILSLLAVTISEPFRWLVDLQMAFGAYEVGVIQRTPVPDMQHETKERLASLASRAWSLRMARENHSESSCYFTLPTLVASHGDTFHTRAEAWHNTVDKLDSETANTLQEIDRVCYELYRFSAVEKAEIGVQESKGELKDADYEDESTEEDTVEVQDIGLLINGLLSWTLGVAFGRFGLTPSPIPHHSISDPFLNVPSISPGMQSAPVRHVPVPVDGILLDDAGHHRDMLSLFSDVFNAAFGCDADKLWYEAIDGLGMDSREWLRTQAFGEHLARYSKSRRYAPIYWPLSTPSGSYTLWLYYHCLTDQTLYTCVNDYVEPKIKQVSEEADRLRRKSNRSSAGERELEQLSELELELKDFRDELLSIAKFWKPNLNDGVQITAAPLWKLFQHKPWQKKLKETWEKLEAGEYDWAHLALSIWPDRVVRASHKDCSYAIAHDLEDHLWNEVEVDKVGRGGRVSTKTESQPRELSEAELDAIVAEVKAR